MRDTQLDIYRALLMMYIPCVIHVLYWLGDGKEPYISVMLVEMPLVFSLSGAAFSVSRSRRGLWPTFLNRAKRVVLPYYIYAAVLVGIGLIASLLCLKTGFLRSFHLDITRYGWNDIMAIVLGRDIPQFPFIWHLWFIPPYLVLSCTFPLQVKLMKKMNSWLYLAICLLLFWVVQAHTGISLLRQVLCYNVFMVSGYLFYKKLNNRTVLLAGATALAIVLVGVLGFGVDFCPMQGHKFPPDWLFVIYNLFVLCFVALIVSRFTISNNWLFRIWSERGYNIYLYQSVVFAIVHVLRQQLYCDVASTLVRTMLDAVMVLSLSTGLSYLTYPVERFIMNKIRF